MNFATLMAQDRPRIGAEMMILITTFSLAGLMEPFLDMLVKRSARQMMNIV